MIDTHCHLTDPRLGGQLDAVLFRARAAGVTRFITIGTDLADARRCVDLCRGRDDIRCAVGVHPNHVTDVDRAELPTLRQLQADPSVVAIGEVGLDYHYGRDHRDQQVEFLNVQLELATAAGRAVVIHCRQAMEDCLAILRSFPAVRAVFHCFTGTPAEARAVLDAGYLIGFTGVVTFKNGGELRQVATDVPADRYLIETDAPYLAPEPVRRQKVNEPALVVHVAAKLAEVRGITVSDIAEQSTRNASALFGWPAGRSPG